MRFTILPSFHDGGGGGGGAGGGAGGGGSGGAAAVGLAWMMITEPAPRYCQLSLWMMAIFSVTVNPKTDLPN